MKIKRKGVATLIVEKVTHIRYISRYESVCDVARKAGFMLFYHKEGGIGV